MRRTVKTRRRVEGGTRRTVVAGGKGSGLTPLDDRALSIAVSRDRKRLIVVLPYEIWILDAKDLSRQRAIELDLARPTVAEDAEGLLWIGGRHLYRGSSWGTNTTKVGSKLGGFVDHVALLRPDLLCGVGHTGEVLFEVADENVAHRRKVGEHPVFDLIATPDERAMWADGSRAAWLIDPPHPQGYTQVHLKRTSAGDVFAEGIVALGLTTRGRCLLGARDGAVAWTGPDMRIAGERFPRTESRRLAASSPLGLVGDERWVYVLRPRGLLQRFLIAQPAPKKKSRDDGPRPGRRKEPEPEPLPEAQSCRLARPADCLALLSDDAGKSTLVLAGSHADGHLGRLWTEDPDALEWSDLALGQRTLHEDPEPEPAAAPSFVATRSKLSGAPLREIKVDTVLAGKTAFWVTHDHGTLLDRPVETRDAGEVLPGDGLLLPAMIRFREGTARPALLLWGGVVDEEREAPAPRWLTWGDASSGWVELDTPAIRTQRWSRTDVFPLQVALASALPEAPGRRAKIPERWADPESFQALARECKKLLKVLW